MINNTAQFGCSGMPSEQQVRNSITFQDVPGDSQAQNAFIGASRRNVINVAITYDGDDQPTLLKNQRVTHDAKGDILLAPLIQNLTQQGFAFDGQVITYFSDKDQTFVFAGKYPVPNACTVPLEDFNQNQPLQIKLRPNGTPSNRQRVGRMTSLISAPESGSSPEKAAPTNSSTAQQRKQQTPQQMHQVGEEEKSGGKASVNTRSKRITKEKPASNSNSRAQEKDEDDGDGKDKGKRTKERSIEEIIQKVSLWRRLYNGVLRDGNLVRYSLEDAATKVNVSKKSLDDYLLQLRFGKKFSFDFQKHKNDKVGTLRAFVKKMKAEDKKKGGDKSSPGKD